jgi:predicted lipid-binding transport protein (Tim44 family)
VIMSEPISSTQSSSFSTSASGLNTQDKQMGLNHHESVSAAASVPTTEPLGAALGKVGVVWGGLFMGISLGDVVLLATLVYTLLQIYLLVAERIVKPLLAARRLAASANELSQEN